MSRRDFAGRQVWSAPSPRSVWSAPSPRSVRPVILPADLAAAVVSVNLTVAGTGALVLSSLDWNRGVWPVLDSAFAVVLYAAAAVMTRRIRRQ